ncbi:MAG: hypothetical protein JW913_08870 [Chitinispirillaceae bacterium]|nr:hypothetical protein [Chitinispirillaceae bacterium]
MTVRRGVGVAAIALLIGMNASAQFTPQNARVNALGGTFIMDDMNDVLRYAVFMDQYKDGAQATFNGPGPITGIKSIGDVLSVGVIANRGLLLNASFYQQGGLLLSTGVPTLPLALTAQNVPHLLLGIDVSVVSLGFDFFYEYASASYHNETTATPPVITDSRVRIHNPGGIASVLFGPEEIPIALKFGVGVPSISGKNDDGTTETKVESDKGIFIEAGGEVDLPAGDLHLTLGMDLIFENYAFSLNGADPATQYGNNRLAFYGGFEGDLFSAGKWGAMYDLYVVNGKTTTAVDTTRNRTLVQTLSGGIENIWTSVWIFDECFARGGLTFAMTTPSTYSRTAASINRQRQQTTYSNVIPTVGAGVKKSVFKLDVTLNPTAWTGAVAGPAVGMVTATVMF